uniref:Ornithine aminotransferase n=1 Tax=Aureoumbra lagunensis TaxID=44058 RepID=A0A7S3NMQ6_9STRA
MRASHRVLQRFVPRELGTASKALIEKEGKYGAENYSPLPVVLNQGKGTRVWDVDGNSYLDFLSAYSAVNQGHCHPKIIEALHQQASRLTLTSRAFHNDMLGPWCELATSVFGFERLLPMNSGVEACETAIKLARRYAYDIRGFSENSARVIFAQGNFWGRSISAVSSSNDPSSYTGFGPFTPGFTLVPYGNIEALENEFKKGNCAAFCVEPIQGEAGVIVPPSGYLAACRQLCDEYAVLLICDEVQTGIGRTGKLLCSTGHENVRPDILTLGKALSGGIFPVSAILTSSEIMLTIRPGEHGSTFGGSPLACAVATAALKALLDEGMIDNAALMGERLHNGLVDLCRRRPKVAVDTRGRGLLRALIVANSDASDVCLALRDLGLLAKPTHNNVIRLAPPLIITADEIDSALHIFDEALSIFDD